MGVESTDDVPWRWITPSVIVGSTPPVSRTCRVTTVEEAVEVIERLDRAVLPAGAWDLAEQVLLALGLDERARQGRIRLPALVGSRHEYGD